MKTLIRLNLAALLVGATAFVHADMVGSLGTIVPSGTVAFSNSNVTQGSLGPPSYNFLDRWSFTLGADASVSSIAATIYFAGPGAAPTFGINNLQLSLVANPVSGPPLSSWLTVTTPAPGLNQLVALVPPAPLGAGDYFLEVRGTVVTPGSYSGSLIAAPSTVPLPASLPLLLSGLCAVGVAGLRRKRPNH